MSVKTTFCYSELVATILDVAKYAGVSASTAKRAIRDPNKLKASTLAKVQSAIDHLGYEPDQLASALRSGHNNSVGLIIGSLAEAFFAELTREIGALLRARGYTLLIADNDYSSAQEKQQLQQFHGNRVAGIIMRSGYGASNLDYMRRLRDRGVAIVEVDHFYTDSPFSHVMLDNRGAVAQGLKYLHGLGHRNIAPLGMYHKELWPDERCAAFPEVMQALGLDFPRAYRIIMRPRADEAYQATKKLMQLAEPPTALFAQTGHVAIGAFQALKDLGLAVPEQVSLLSFDNYPWTTLVSPSISVIAQPVQDMAVAAVESLLSSIDALKAGKTPPVIKQRFVGELVIRESCQKL